MYIVGHAAVGAFLARAAGASNPAAAFAIGFASHYLADLVPHGDEEVGDWTKRGNELRRLTFVFAIDAAILLALSATFIAVRGFDAAVAAAIVGSALPDVLWGLEKVFRKKLFGPHGAFHLRNHNYFKVRFPAWAGFLAQGAVAGLLWGALIG